MADDVFPSDTSRYSRLHHRDLDLFRGVYEGEINYVVVTGEFERSASVFE